MNKKILTGLVVTGLFTGLSTQALASSGFENTLNQQLGNGASVSCNACHSGATTSATATFPMANTYRAARTANDYTLIATSDSDGDGYINKFEVNGAATDFNVVATSPFTKATAANGDASVKTLADNAAVSAAFVDSTTAPLATTGQVILGDIKVTLKQADTLYFKAGGVDAAAKIYTVDAAGVGTDVTADCTISAVDGSLKVNVAPAGGFPANYVVVQGTPATAAAGTIAQETASIYGCTTTSLSTPLLMFLAMLSLGFFVRHRRA
ncbi:MAG: hypothetical protein Q9N67_02995 [Ghiorsea sp.]|nr:hypothetical protein [Ghiorsea sp.]